MEVTMNLILKNKSLGFLDNLMSLVTLTIISVPDSSQIIKNYSGPP